MRSPSRSKSYVYRAVTLFFVFTLHNLDFGFEYTPTVPFARPYANYDTRQRHSRFKLNSCVSSYMLTCKYTYTYIHTYIHT